MVALNQNLGTVKQRQNLQVGVVKRNISKHIHLVFRIHGFVPTLKHDRITFSRVRKRTNLLAVETSEPIHALMPEVWATDKKDVSH